MSYTRAPFTPSNEQDIFEAKRKTAMFDIIQKVATTISERGTCCGKSGCRGREEARELCLRVLSEADVTSSSPPFGHRVSLGQLCSSPVWSQIFGRANERWAASLPSFASCMYVEICPPRAYFFLTLLA